MIGAFGLSLLALGMERKNIGYIAGISWGWSQGEKKAESKDFDDYERAKMCEREEAFHNKNKCEIG